MHALALTHLLLLAPDDKAPDDNDVVAGPIGAIIFIALILAVALIGWALTRSLRTAERAKEAGVYGDEPAEPDAAGDDAGASPAVADSDDAHPSEPGPDWR